MSSRISARFAWGGVGLCLTMVAAFGILWLLNRPTTVPVNFGTRAAAVILAFASVPFASVGALIISRRSMNSVGWVCLAIGLLLAGTHLVGEYAAYALLTDPGSLPRGDLAAWLFNWLWVLYVALIGVYLILIFPEGHLPSRRWRLVPWIAGAGTLSAIIYFALAPGPLQSVSYASNPFGLKSAGEALELLSLGFFVVPLCIVASGASMIVRFRRAKGDERQQLKWFASAAALTASAYFGQSIVALVTGTLDDPSGAHRIVQDAVVLSFYALPVATGIAILKYHLYDIDVIINRTLVYGALTSILALVYAAGVVSIGATLRSLIGQEANRLAVTASTLVVAGMFRPLRGRTQAVIDRRFFRSKYDAATMLEHFSAKLRDEVDLDALTCELLTVVKQTLQPARVSVWLRAPSDAPQHPGGAVRPRITQDPA